MMTSKWAMGLVLLSTLSAASGQILIKTGVNNIVLEPLSVISNVPLVAGYFLYALAAVMLVVSLKYGELSVLYPIYAMNFVWVAIMSPIFFPLTDSMNSLKWTGVFAIVVGVSYIGVGSNREVISRKKWLMSLGVIGLVAAYGILDFEGWAGSNRAKWWAVILVLIAAAAGSFGSLYFKRGAERLEFNFRSLTTNLDLLKGVLVYGSSTIFYVIGIKGGELSVLFPLVSTGYIWVCFISVRFLGERMNSLKWTGIGLILFGVSLIGLGS